MKLSASPPRLDLVSIAERVPFYRALWREHGLALSPTPPWDLIPILTKQHLRQATRSARLDRRFEHSANRSECSGGSTGEPVETLIDPPSRRRRQWRFLKALVHAGYRPGHHLWIVSTHRPSRVNRLARWTYVDLRETEADLAQRYLDERPQVLYGPLRALLAMAERLPRGSTPPLRALVATAEQLGPQDQRILLERFGIEAADFYGMTEIGLYAFRCPGDRQYRHAAPDIHSEFLPCKADGKLERLIITTLGECAMPLIRYDTGDLVRRDHSTRGSPIVEFAGREIDSIQLPGGGLISPYRLTLALESVPAITRYQVVQHEDLSLEVHVAAALDLDEALTRAVRAVTGVVGPELPVRGGADFPPARPGEKFRPIRSYARR